jgi:hypothetical protein
LATVGLEGTHGFPYGPLPTWLYQGFLTASHDLRSLVVARALATMGLVALGSWWTASAMGVSPWLCLVALVSPYLWLYARLIWDNSFLIPLSALAVGSYARALARPSRAMVFVAVCATLLLPLIHLMSLALVLALGAHAIVFARPTFWRYRWTALASAIAVLAMAAPYLRIVAATRTGGGFHPTWEGFGFPLLGARWLSASGLDYFFGESWQAATFAPAAVTLAGFVSCFIYAFVWAGMGLAILSAWRAHRLHPSADEPDLRARLSWLALLIVAAQCLLDGLAGASGHPHYYNATWMAFVMLAWLPLGSFLERARTKWIPGAYTSVLVFVLVALIVRVRVWGGTRGDHYGPTLDNQLEVAEAIMTAPAGSKMSTNVPHYLQFGHGLEALIRLAPRAAKDDGATPVRLLLHYASENPNEGRVELRRMP